MSNRRIIESKGHTNRKMNDDTYGLRRKVMGFIYEAKDLLGDKFKRIDIRITDCDRNAMGTARMGDCMIWIPASTLTETDTTIRHVVFHEIAHAIFAAKHDNKCPLMAPVIQTTTRRTQDKALLKIANNV